MDEILKNQIIEIWNEHVSSNQFVLDGNGHAVNNIDDSRLEAIEVIKVIIRDYITDEINLVEFKSALDVFNRHNNLWNFSAKMGQMYFNLLIKSNEDNIEKLSDLLKSVISEPKDLKEALKKIEELEKFTNAIFLTAEDKRKVPYPGSVGYFLSYFWQVHNPHKWPIIYSSLINGFREVGIWKDQTTQKSSYNFFYGLNEELKLLLNQNSKKEISNWDIEHAFWNFKFSKNPYQVAAEEIVPKEAENKVSQTAVAAETPVAIEPAKEEIPLKSAAAKTVPTALNFDIHDYLIPKVTKLLQIKEDSPDISSYEPLVAEVFKQMEFEVSLLPQGPRKNPYAALKFREDNTAFLTDIRFSSGNYFSTTDDRALKESIKDNCIDLTKEGYKKIGFIIVCDSFNDIHTEFINYINWHTEIKKLILITSEALLYLLAYKTKDKIKIEKIIENMSNFGQVVTGADIIAAYDKD